MRATITSVEAFDDTRDGTLERRARVRALFGSAVGGAIEWYDYFLYGTMASLVFAPLFFPNGDAVTSHMLSLASFALAFLVRPVGGWCSATLAIGSAASEPW